MSRFFAMFTAFLAATAHPTSSKQPTVRVKNGTLGGVDLSAFDQELFLGVPFAQAPLGDLRFRHPAQLNGSWDGVKDATARSSSCPGYTGFSAGLTLGEDCLTLDIARPKGIQIHDRLPVLVWIYGGGFLGGGTADPRYNTSYLVNASISIQKPMIAVSINYRLAGWGFLASREMAEDGALNIGLFDQRLALRWIQENIAAFGGDPDAVTINGESAGAYSVGCHIVGFDGNNEGLFRGAILQSATSIGPPINSIDDLATTYQLTYDNVTSAVGCDNSTDTLDCLRRAPYADLYEALSTFLDPNPVIDGEFLRRRPSESYEQGLFANVAILAGTNTDEGTATFIGPRGSLNTDADFANYLAGLASGLDNETVVHLMELYPDDPTQGCPFNTGEERFAQNGYQYKRGAAFAGDNKIIAGRRATTRYHSSLKGDKRRPVYSYRFDQAPWNGIQPLVAVDAPVYATHYSEICFTFNIEPSASVNNTNWIGPYPEYYELSNQMSRAWISFVHGMNPNGYHLKGSPVWPEYGTSEENMVFKVGQNSIERDDWRADQIEYLNTISAALKT
ncbi:alpha/beta-hydrolase [Byssothecium circinans]|uniref:Carboxylic ester hydrolase n=1 Tax=Byssothecium circinans TaxID=147558 RepID=A0A6A5U9P5_9PLEO|nr:alpha/beta-hydrolase [Byssothecium circinans]